MFILRIVYFNNWFNCEENLLIAVAVRCTPAGRTSNPIEQESEPVATVANANNDSISQSGTGELPISGDGSHDEDSPSQDPVSESDTVAAD